MVALRCLVEHRLGEVDIWGRGIARGMQVVVMILRMMHAQGTGPFPFRPRVLHRGHGLRCWKIFFGLLRLLSLYTLAISIPIWYICYAMTIELEGNNFQIAVLCLMVWIIFINCWLYFSYLKVHYFIVANVCSIHGLLLCQQW